MRRLRLTIKFLQDRLVEATQAEGFNVVILMHKLDAARNLVYDDFLFFIVSYQQLS